MIVHIIALKAAVTTEMLKYYLFKVTDCVYTQIFILPEYDCTDVYDIVAYLTESSSKSDIIR